LIVNTTGGTELYDLVQDPFEHVNLADSEPGEIDDVVQELIDRYNQMVEQGKVVGTGEIQPEFVDELKALGYL
jgi:predicted urease superfamily metal-dependent hydrolase